MNHNVKTILSVLSTALVAVLVFGCSNTEEQSPATGTGDQTLQCGSAALHAAAHDSCAAMDANAAPDDSGSNCFCMLGFAWNGTDCVALGDCQCKGADCDKLSASQEECLQQHAACKQPEPKLTCGSTGLFAKAHGACEAMDARAAGDDQGHCYCSLGYAWNGSECAHLADCVCEGTDCDKLTQTLEECQQKHSSCEQPAPSYHCGSIAMYAKAHEVCAPMDVKEVGANGDHCDCMLGYAWNGAECVGLGDCGCEGADCDKLTKTIEECQQKHESCGSVPEYHCGLTAFPAKHEACSAMDAQGNNLCNCGPFGYKWNGSACEGITCSCTGADCDSLASTLDECQAAHANCN